MQVPAFAAKDLEQRMSNFDGNLSFNEFIEQWTERDPASAIANVQKSHPKWPAKFLPLYIQFGWISDIPDGWYLRGVARRIVMDDLDDFGLFIQMHVRQCVLNHDPGGGDEALEIWSLLKALAIADDDAIELWLARSTFPMTHGHPDTVTIYNGVQAILRSNKSQQTALLKAKSSEKKSEWLSGKIECLQGIVSGKPKVVASGLERHLAGFRKAFRLSTLEKLISLDAHGLYRLAERVDPELVEDFDTNRELPWDREFHEWSNEWRPTLAIDHFGKCPKALASAFVTLENPPPPWTRPYRAWPDNASTHELWDGNVNGK
jgi:hypothetical protein